MIRVGSALLAAAILISGCAALDDDCYTLYRNSTMYQDQRLHVATFDSLDGAPYNLDNCQTARRLFQEQPGVRTRYWCEKGRFRRHAPKETG